MKYVKPKRGIGKMAWCRLVLVVPVALFLALSVVGFGYAGSATSAQQPTTPASKTRNLSTFHDLHIEKLKLTCDACHVSQEAPSYLRVEAGILEVAPTNDRAIVNRQACFRCHAPSKPIFGDRPLKAGELYRK